MAIIQLTKLEHAMLASLGFGKPFAVGAESNFKVDYGVFRKLPVRVAVRVERDTANGSIEVNAFWGNFRLVLPRHNFANVRQFEAEFDNVSVAIRKAVRAKYRAFKSGDKGDS